MSQSPKSWESSTNKPQHPIFNRVLSDHIPLQVTYSHDPEVEIQSNNSIERVRLSGIRTPSPVQPTLSHGSNKFDPTFKSQIENADPTRASGLSHVSSSRDEAVFPEGGTRAWMVVLGSFCGMLAAFGMMNIIGTFQAYLSTHQLKEYSDSTIGWIFSLYAFLSFFCGVQIGPIFDAKGPRWLVMAGSVSLVASMMLLGICTKYWHFLITYGILGGVGTSLIFTPAVASIGHFFLERRGMATGIATTGGSVGGIVFPIMLQSLFPKVGFPWATRILGLIFIVLLIAANLLIRDRLPHTAAKSTLPSLGIFRDVSFALTTLGVFMLEFGLFVPLTYLSSYALHAGIPLALSYQLLSILNVGSFFGRWIPGLLADRFGRFNTMILATSLCLLTVFCFWLPAGGSVPILVVYALLFGFASGSNISLTPVCVGQLCKTENYGRYYATCYTIVSFGTLTGIPIAGQILTTCGGKYWGLILFTGLCYCGGWASFVSARILAVGWKPAKVF